MVEKVSNPHLVPVDSILSQSRVGAGQEPEVTDITNVACPVPQAFVAAISTSWLPDDDVVPVINPVVVLIDSPVGNPDAP